MVVTSKPVAVHMGVTGQEAMLTQLDSVLVSEILCGRQHQA
jgi:hypothetical protein